MKGKLFFVDKGVHITIRNSDMVAVSFDSPDSFRKYYSGNLDISQAYYID